AGARSRPVGQYSLHGCVAGVDVAMHDRNQGTSTGGKHRAETILKRALGISPAEHDRFSVVVEPASEPSPDGQAGRGSRFDHDLAFITNVGRSHVCTHVT